MRVRAWLAVLLTLLFVGALWWAKARDPFERIWFTVRSPVHGSAKCIAVFPKTVPRPLPVVVYLHGSGGSLLGSGNELRQIAEMGLAAVGIEYNQTNDVACEVQFDLLLRRLAKQRWADTNSVAWVGFSLGAQRQMSFLLKHPESPPKLLVRLAGGWVPEFEQSAVPSPQSQAPKSKTNVSLVTRHLSRMAVLLIHSDQDSVFPAADIVGVADALRTNGVSVNTEILHGQSHGLDSNREVVFRAIGEYCLTHLKGGDPLKDYRSIALWQSQAKPLWVYWIPAFLWVGVWLYWRRRTSSALRRPRAPEPPEGGTPNAKLTGWEMGLRWFAGLVAAMAIGQTAFHLIPPWLAISGKTLTIARNHFIQAKEKTDFEFLTNDPLWRGKRLTALLTHIELANYNRELVNWKVDDKLYRDCVLSPVIGPEAYEELNWRRPLWERFYPRIRKEHKVEAAAEIVVRHLRQRLTIAGGENYPVEVESVWKRQITNKRGFEMIYVAAMRSVGIPARLSAQGQAELCSEVGWKVAPRPLLESLVQ